MFFNLTFLRAAIFLRPAKIRRCLIPSLSETETQAEIQVEIQLAVLVDIAD